MLEVREQVRLSLKRLLDICLDSVSHRLLRSAVTVVIILLAIAFLAFIMVEGYLGRGTRDAVSTRTSRMTAYTRFVRQASEVASDEGLVRSFATLVPDTSDFENLVAWGGFSASDARAFIESSRTFMTYLDFFDGIPVGRRVLLVEQHTGPAIFAWLQDDANRTVFSERLASMKSLRLPGTGSELQMMLGEWPAYRQQLDKVRQRYTRTIAAVGAYSGEGGIGRKLADAIAAGDTDVFFAKLIELGLRVDEGVVRDVVYGLKHHEQLSWAYSHLRKVPVRMGWNREFQERFSPGQALESCARLPGRVDWIKQRLAANDLDAGFDVQEFARIADEHQEWNDLMAKEHRLRSRYGVTDQLDPKTVWLICVSFLVCVVGIANAMLMSVLERFKEIATMKCLGARSGTIAFLFVTESTIIGIVGGIGGVIAGFVIVFLRLTGQYGRLVFERFPGADIAVTFVVCLCCSLLLAMVAAIYPAWVASRMAPMEAMRVD